MEMAKAAVETKRPLPDVEPINIKFASFGPLVIARWVGDANIASIQHGREEMQKFAAANMRKLYCIVILAAPLRVPSGAVMDASRAWTKELKEQCDAYYVVFETEGIWVSLLKTAFEGVYFLIGARGFMRYAASGEEAIRQSCQQLGTEPGGPITAARKLGMIK